MAVKNTSNHGLQTNTVHRQHIPGHPPYICSNSVVITLALTAYAANRILRYPIYFPLPDLLTTLLNLSSVAHPSAVSTPSRTASVAPSRTLRDSRRNARTAVPTLPICVLLPVDNRVDPSPVHPYRLGQPILIYVHGLQELFFQYLSGMNGRQWHKRKLFGRIVWETNQVGPAGIEPTTSRL